MKSLKTWIMSFALAFVLLGMLQLAHAADVTLAWDASLSPEATGYRLYVNGGEPIDVGNALTHSLELPDGQPYQVYATAYAADGLESGPSNLLTFTIPEAPGNLRVTVTVTVQVAN